jgi:hypothetical protein
MEMMGINADFLRRSYGEFAAMLTWANQDDSRQGNVKLQGGCG